MQNSVADIQAIDVHAHYGIYRGDGHPFRNDLMTGDGAEVVRRARAVKVEWTVVSPLTGLLPRGGGDPVKGNEEAAEVVPKTPGLLQWVVIDPLTPATYEQADRMLREQPRCVGIKIHPEEHRYPIKEHGRAIFEFAAARRAVVLTHSGESNSMPGDFIPFADEFPDVRLILAHIGCASDGDHTRQAKAVAQSKHGNVYADTSSAMSIMPKLIEWAVKEVGAERVLFGTDTPLYSTAMQRARINHADLSDEQKRLILRANAERLLKIPRTA